MAGVKLARPPRSRDGRRTLRPAQPPARHGRQWRSAVNLPARAIGRSPEHHLCTGAIVSDPTTVALLDDHGIVLEGLTRLLERSGFDVLAAEHDPDVFVRRVGALSRSRPR